jgi:D-alanine-D-alanine ligase
VNKVAHSQFSTDIGTVGVFMGGASRERNISLRSGVAIAKALESLGFRVEAVDTANDFRTVLQSGRIDFAFPALHGLGGEDGKLQAVLAHHEIPYVGSDPQASALAFHKFKAKKCFETFKIQTPDFARVTHANLEYIFSSWPPPYVLKPAEEGSSIDVTFVSRKSQGKKEMAAKLDRYSELLIERVIKGRECTVAILGGEALPVIEITTTRSFYDFTAKYTTGFTNYLVPAPISHRLEQRLKNIALQAHRALGLRDLSRVDFMVAEDESPFVLEVNSIPGFTETSLLPKAALHAGIDFQSLCVQLLKLAYARNLTEVASVL